MRTEPAEPFVPTLRAEQRAVHPSIHGNRRHEYSTSVAQLRQALPCLIGGYGRGLVQ
jgi:hypothetical protein